MSYDAHTNFAYTTVATAPSPATSGTSLTVATGKGALFPAVPFNATVWPASVQPLSTNAEIVRVTNITGDVLTITRAQESTSAISIAVGYQIAATITAKVITDLESGITAALTNIKVSAGTLSTLRSDLTFANSNGVTFGLNTNGVITASAAGGAGSLNVSAGTTSNNLTNVVFSNANNVSFGLNGSTVTASIANYITTARASTDAIGLNTAQSNVTWTVNSSGLSLDARGYVGTATGATNASVTANSNGVSVSVGPYLTTAMASNRGSDFVQATAAFAGTNATGTIASTGISVSVAPVTAGSDTFGISNLGNTAGTSGVVSGDQVRVLFAGGNNVTLSQSVNGASATITMSVGNYITTARASTDAVGLNTAQSNVTWTVNSSGLSLDARGYAGTGTTFNGTNVSATVGLNSAGLNLSLSAPAAGGGGTLTLFAGGNTTGQSSSSSFNASSLPFSGAGNVSVGYSGGSVIISGGTAAASPVNVSAGTTSNNLGTIVFSNSNAVSFGLSGSTVTASVSTYSTIGTATTVYAVGTAAATVGTADRWAREDHIHAWQDVTESIFYRPNDNLTTVGAPINGSASVIYCPIDHNLSASRFDAIASVNVATAANASTAGFLYSITAALYTLNGGTLSSVYSATTATQMTWSSNVTGQVTGGFLLSAPLAVNLSADKYWVGIALSTRATGMTGANTTSLGNTVSMLGIGSAIHGAFSARELGAATNSSAGWFIGMGMYSGTSNFATIGLSNLTQQGTNANRANVALRMVNI